MAYIKCINKQANTQATGTCLGICARDVNMGKFKAGNKSLYLQYEIAKWSKNTLAIINGQQETKIIKYGYP